MGNNEQAIKVKVETDSSTESAHLFKMNYSIEQNNNDSNRERSFAELAIR